MRKALLLLILCLFVLACENTSKEKRVFCLQGAWILRQVKYPDGMEHHYSMKGSGTYCLLYERDSILYECSLTKIPSGYIIMPTTKSQVTLIDKGNGERLYFEDGDPHPLTTNGDSTITIQRTGTLFTYVRANDVYQEWGNDIHDIITKEMDNETNTERSKYVLSAKERQQERTLQWHGYIFTFFIVIALLIAQYAIYKRTAMRRLLLQLQQIQEVQENRPPEVRQAAKSVEDTFFASDDYAALQRRMANGQTMKEEEWQQVEQHLKTLYPGFATQLRSLHPMSELEYQTCLLIKLRIAPKDIANVLSRDVSTISTVRSRLYKKVFGHKGGTKEWDDFILSM